MIAKVVQWIKERASTTLCLTRTNPVLLEGNRRNKIIPHLVSPTTPSTKYRRPSEGRRDSFGACQARSKPCRVQARYAMQGREVWQATKAISRRYPLTGKPLCSEALWTNCATKWLAVGKGQQSATKHGVVCVSGATALKAKTTNTMVAEALEFVPNGTNSRPLLLGLRITAFLQILRLTAETMMATTRQTIVGGLLMPFREKINQTQDGSSLMAFVSHYLNGLRKRVFMCQRYITDWLDGQLSVHLQSQKEYRFSRDCYRKDEAQHASFDFLPRKGVICGESVGGGSNLQVRPSFTVAVPIGRCFSQFDRHSGCSEQTTRHIHSVEPVLGYGNGKGNRTA